MTLFKKIVAVVVVFTHFNNAVLSYGFSPAFQSKPASVLAFPASSLAKSHQTQHLIRLSHLTKSKGPVVIHIQDVHMNTEAQISIGQDVEDLLQTGRVDLIALEGAFGDVDLEIFRKYPYQASVKKAADTLFQDKKITGVIHAALTTGQSLPPIVGIDDLKHYQANVRAYQESLPLKEDWLSDLKALQLKHAVEKPKVLNPALKKFDSQVEAYRRGELPLSDFLKTLVQFSTDGKIQDPQVKDFLSALELESRLDFSLVEKSRTRFLSALAQKLDPKKSSFLFEKTREYHEGRIGQSAFLLWVRDVSRAAGIHLSDYPGMDDYIRYIVLSEKINPDELLEIVAACEKKIFRSLIKTPAEEALIEKSHALYLSQKLVSLSLTKDEWDEYQELRFRLPGLKDFEAFYNEAVARDEAMSTNLLSAMREHNAQVVVLVTGGFHSAGLAQTFRKNRIDVRPLTPRITKIDSLFGTDYLSVFVQKKAPLEKLFEGDRLFLTPVVDSPAIQRSVAVETVRAESNFHRTSFCAQFFRQVILGVGGGFVTAFSFLKRVVMCIANRRGVAVVVEGPKGSSQLSIAFPDMMMSAIDNRASSGENEVVIGAIKDVVDHLKRRGHGPGKKSGVWKQRAENLSLAHQEVLSLFSEAGYKFLPPLQIHIVQGAQTVAYVKKDLLGNDYVALDVELLDHPDLLVQEFREEYEHLWYRYALAQFEGRLPNDQERALHELATDLLKVKEFAGLERKQQVRLARSLINYSQESLLEIFIRALPPMSRVKVVNEILKKLSGTMFEDAAKGTYFTQTILENSELVAELRHRYLQARYQDPAIKKYLEGSRPGEIESDLARFLRSYNDLKAMVASNEVKARIQLADGINFIPQSHRTVLNDSNATRSYFETLFPDVEALAILEPHHDDIAVGPSNLVATLAKAYAPEVEITSVVSDPWGIPTEIIPPGPISVDEARQMIREKESRSFGKSLGVRNLKIHTNFIEIPVNIPVRDSAGNLDPIRSGFSDFTPEQLEQVVQHLRDLTANKKTLLVLPRPYQNRPEGLNPAYNHVHPHHDRTYRLLMEALKRIKYEGPIIFYTPLERLESPQGLVDPELSILPPLEETTYNGHFIFGEELMRVKKDRISLFESQVSRRDYRKISEERSRRQFQRAKEAGWGDSGKLEGAQYAEGFWFGRLEYTDTAVVEEETSLQPSGIIAMIMAGGQSLRLFPIPKLFIPVLTFPSVLVHTILRFTEKLTDPESSFLDPENIRIVASPENRVRALQNVGQDAGILESQVDVIPTSESGDLNGMLWGMANLKVQLEQEGKDGNPELIFVPGDTIVSEPRTFRDIVQEGLEILSAHPHALVMLGQNPPSKTPVSTWMELGAIKADINDPVSKRGYRVVKFVEKAPRPMAQAMMHEVGWSFNLAVNIARLNTMEKAVQDTQPQIYDLYEKMVEALRNGETEMAHQLYVEMSERVPHPHDSTRTTRPSWDYSVSMKIGTPALADSEVEFFVIPSNLEFHDIGTWQSLYDASPKDPHGNVMLGDGGVDLNDVSESLIFGEGDTQTIIASGVSGLVIAHAANGQALVMPRDQTSDIRNAVKETLEKIKQGDKSLLFGAVDSNVVDGNQGFLLVGAVKGLDIIKLGTVLIVKPTDAVLELQRNYTFTADEIEILRKYKVDVLGETSSPRNSNPDEGGFGNFVIGFIGFLFTLLTFFNPSLANDTLPVPPQTPLVQVIQRLETLEHDPSLSDVEAALKGAWQTPADLGVRQFDRLIGSEGRAQRLTSLGIQAVYVEKVQQLVQPLPSDESRIRVSVYHWGQDGHISDEVELKKLETEMRKASLDIHEAGRQHDFVIVVHSPMTSKLRAEISTLAQGLGVPCRIAHWDTDFPTAPASYRQILVRILESGPEGSLPAVNAVVKKTASSVRFATYSRSPNIPALDDDLRPFWVGFFNLGQGWATLGVLDLTRILEQVKQALKAA